MENIIPVQWISALEEHEMEFIKRFILSSGSLKELAGMYQVSYPTIRLRLDQLIQKIKWQEENKGNLEGLIKEMALKDEISMEAAKILLQAYRLQERENEKK